MCVCSKHVWMSRQMYKSGGWPVGDLEISSEIRINFYEWRLDAAPAREHTRQQRRRRREAEFRGKSSANTNPRIHWRIQFCPIFFGDAVSVAASFFFFSLLTSEGDGKKTDGLFGNSKLDRRFVNEFRDSWILKLEAWSGGVWETYVFQRLYLENQ